MKDFPCYSSIKDFPEPLLKIYHRLKEDLKYMYKYQKPGQSVLGKVSKYFNSFLDWNEIFDVRPGMHYGSSDCYYAVPKKIQPDTFNAVKNGNLCKFMEYYLKDGNLEKAPEKDVEYNKKYSPLYLDLDYIYSACLNTAKLIKFYPLNFTEKIVYSGYAYDKPYNYKQFSVGQEFIVSHFLSTSTRLSRAMWFSGEKGLLLKIHLLNNGKNGHSLYGRFYKSDEFEVTLSPFCKFKVKEIKPETSLEWKSEESNPNSELLKRTVTILELECYGNDL